MGMPLIPAITNIATWTTFAFGTIGNLLLIQFIRKHTPNQLKVYSRILLQTCFTDLLFLFSSLITNPIGFETAKGIGVFNNGIFLFQSAENKFWNAFLYISWVYLSYVSLFGFVAQFIYRYLILNLDKRPSMIAYLLILAGVLVVPTIYITMFALCYYPADQNLYLEDQAIADIIFETKNISENPIMLAGFATFTPLLNYGFYYIIICCTIAYIAICLLGWLMHKRVKNSHTGIIGLQQQKMKEMNRQITMTLSIQAALPSTIYVPLIICLGTLALGVDTSPNSGMAGRIMQYYYMLFVVPMFFPPALNPFIAMATIPAYRRPVTDVLKILLGKSGGTSVAGSNQSAMVDLATRSRQPSVAVVVPLRQQHAVNLHNNLHNPPGRAAGGMSAR